MTQTAEQYAQKDSDADAVPEGTLDLQPGEDPTSVFRTVIGIFQNRRDRLNAERREVLLRLLGQIMPDVEISARRDLALALVRDPGADRGLISLVLNDRADIAYPVLERSQALTDEDQLRIIAERPSAFRRAIAARPALSGKVCAALARTGDPIVLGTMLANSRTRIPQSVFPGLVSAARQHPELREALAKREDLPSDIAGELAADSAQDAERTAAALAAKLHRAGHLRASVLVGALRQRQVELFEHAFAQLTGLPASRLRQLLRDPSGFPLALAARAARMDRSAFSTVFVNYCEARGESPRMNEADFNRAMDVFRNLPQERARAELHRLAGNPRRPSDVRRLVMDPLMQS